MDPLIWPLLTSILAVVSIGLITLLIIGRERKKSSNQDRSGALSSRLTGMPLVPRRTVSPDVYEEAREKLRVLDLEREILGYAIRRLHEAHAEGRINKEERDRLAEKYRLELERIKEEIARGESIVALNELERMQEEFIKLFSERFDELTRRIEQLRTISGLPPPKKEGELEIGEEKEEGEEEPQEEKSAKKPVASRPKKRKTQVKPPPKPEKPDVEKRVEQIVAEVEKVLKRLGQMEVEE
ncbi:TPA: DUF1707 domain-containing protein [Candidatus Bathyarchaeota archaeon]|nr:DUF1707 domain-containing protein [Candidatus Bathyarchaeota archaeon]